MKPSNFGQTNKPHISQARRKLVTGLLGATAFTTLAPQQWTQPVINRIVAPAHGQAVSIAAGRYRGQFLVEDIIAEGTCSRTLSIEFDWEGGDEGFTDVLVVSEEREGTADGCSGSNDVGEIEANIPIVVLPSGSRPDLEVFNTDPPLPPGFSFFIDV